MALVTFCLRLLSRPASILLKHPRAASLARILPPAIMILLLLFSLKTGHPSCKEQVLEALAMGVVALAHLTWEKGLLSLSLGVLFLFISQQIL